MKKAVKITLLIILCLIISFIAFTIYNGIKYSQFYEKAENMGSILFGSEIFNEKLKNCELAYGGQSVAGESWEIRGIENNNCIVIYREPKVNYGESSSTISYINRLCKFPVNVYSNGVSFSDLIGNSYCNV
jgi:hypothetical protein